MICVNPIILQLTGAQNIRAPCISVKNILGNISGTYNVSESLMLDTVRGYVALQISIVGRSSNHDSTINASITLVKLTGRGSPTQVTLDTGEQYAYSLTSSKEMDSNMNLVVTSTLR